MKRQEIPKINAILEIFEPTTAPTAIYSELFIIEEMPTNISGADVPRATIVRPIVNSLTPSFSATVDELSINLLAPHISTIKEIVKPKKFIKRSIILFAV